MVDYDIVLNRPSITGESPTWCEREQALYWVDVQQPALHRLDPRTGVDQAWIMPAWIGSFALGGGAADGSAVVALRTGVFRFGFADGALVPIAPAPFDSRRFFLNDGKADPCGRFWVGAMNHPLLPEVGPGETRLELWRLTDGRLQGFGGRMKLSNGLAWSPDGTVMYHSGTEAGVIDAYDFDIESGTPSNRRVFARTEGAGGPDGAAVDRDGFYWSAINGGGRLARYDPDGRLEREIELPVRYPTMCTFGGPDLDVLYVCSGRWPIADKDAAKFPLDGSILALRPPVPGIATHRWLG